MKPSRKIKIPLSWNISLIMLTAWLHLPGRTAAATVTASFENYGGGQFLGFAPVTDPLSGIRFNNINTNGGLGVCFFNSPAGPSLYHNNDVLEENVPQGGVFWSGNFSIHGILPLPASSLSIDVLYDYDRIANPAGPSGTVTLQGFDANGSLVSSVSTPPLTLDLQQTHLSLAFTSPIASFSVLANNISTDYDNVAYTVVPEPTVGALSLSAALAFLTVRTRRPRA